MTLPGVDLVGFVLLGKVVVLLNDERLLLMTRQALLLFRSR
jgi:hypothetical protein